LGDERSDPDPQQQPSISDDESARPPEPLKPIDGLSGGLGMVAEHARANAMFRRHSEQIQKLAEEKAAAEKVESPPDKEPRSPGDRNLTPGQYDALKLTHAEVSASQQQQEGPPARDEDKSANVTQQPEQGSQELSDSQQAQQDKTARFREMMDQSQSQSFSRGDEGRE
jgi:hypothetical protein